MSSKGRIDPRTLKGFRDYLPEGMIAREGLIDTARRVYRSYGFAPIDTPALEYEEVLTGKGGDESDRQLFRFEDPGGRAVAMRFDLTVPLARFAAQHIGKLGTPFKRYHIGPVWRGESPQRGRYREFFQCDFDTIGTQSAASDIETALVIHDLMRAVGFDSFVVRTNDRRLLQGLLQRLELEDKATRVLRALDKLDKIGPDKVAEEMVSAAGASPEQAREVLKLSEIHGSNDEVLDALAPLVAGNELGECGHAALTTLLTSVRAAGVAEGCLRLDPSIARGLDYYTGAVFETFLGDLPGIGSVCSGGRYDNLAELFTNEKLPGVGASLGVDRLLAAMEELGLAPKGAATAPIFLPFFAKDHLSDYLALAAGLRAAGLAVEFYPEPKKLGAQLKYADRRGFRFAVIVGEDEWASGRCQLKSLADGSSREVALGTGPDSLVTALKEALAS
jgi:histidyl-tRNA synthetase